MLLQETGEGPANELGGPNAAAGANTRGLIRFDVSDLAGLAEPITSIEMRFYQYSGVAATVDAHEIADANVGRDTHGYRREFIELVKTARSLDSATDR